MSKEHRESSKSTDNQPPIYITNQIVNNVSPHGEEPQKPKGSIGVIIALAGVIIALLTFLFGEGIFGKFGREGGSLVSSPASSETPLVPSSSSSSAAHSDVPSSNTSGQPVNAVAQDGQTVVTSGQTVKVYTNGDKDIKINYTAKTDTVADYAVIGKRGSQDGQVFHNKKMNPQGGLFTITKWDYFYMTVIEGEISFDAGNDAIVKFEDTPLVVSREIHSGEIYETAVIGDGTATLTIQGIEEDTKGEYQVFPHNSPSENPKSFKLFPTDCFYKMLYPGDKIVITVTSGSVEIYGDYTHFQFQ